MTAGDCTFACGDDTGRAELIVQTLASFGVDAAGEVYVLAFGQPIRQIVRP